MRRVLKIHRLLICLFLCSAASVAVNNAHAANVFNVGVQLEPPNLDPTQGSAAAVDEIVYANIFEGLTGIAQDGTIVPRLAERWQISDEGRTYRFYLRKNVSFHDGTAFDARDVQFSFERAAAPASTNAQKSLFEPISRISIVDSSTLDIYLDRPVGAFLQHLAWGDAVIVAPESAPANAVNPVGTGPFRFSRWRKGVSVDLVRNDDYWGQHASIDGISFRVIPDPTAAFAAVMSGDVDGFSTYPAPENLAQFDQHERFDVVVGTTEGETILAINNKQAPFEDVRVRQALSHAIDKRAVIEGAMFGYGQAIGSHFPPHHPSYIELQDRYPYDPARARLLLADAGFPNGFETVLKLPPPSYARRSGELVVSQLAVIGVQVKIENLEWAQWLDQVFNNRNYALTIVAHTEPLDLDIYSRAGYYFQYESEEFNQIAGELARSSDSQERHDLYQRAQRKLSDDAVNVFLFQLPKAGVWAKGISGAWDNAPLQANDFTAVQRSGLGSTSATGTDGGKPGGVWIIFVGAALGALGYLVYRAGSMFVVRRFVSIIVTMLLATIIIFLLVEVAPGDPASFMMGLNAEPEALTALREEMGLNRSTPARYLAWVGGLVRGDFGISYTYRTPVSELIADRVQVSLPLAIYSIFLALVIAAPAALLAARNRGRATDSAILGATQVGIALPNFWIAILLVLVFAGVLRWFPVGGFPGWEAGLLSGLHSLTLPAISLALPQAAILARVMRSALLDTLGEDYIRTARSKGLSESDALKKHALRNAAIPVLTILGLQFSFLIAGGIIVENVFYLPGLGRLVFQAITQRDLIVVESVVFLLAFATVLISFIVDLGYAAVDPRLQKNA